MDVRCPISRHLLFSVAADVPLNVEIEIKCVCKRMILVRDPRVPEIKPEARTPMRSEPNSREELGYASTNQIASSCG